MFQRFSSIMFSLRSFILCSIVISSAGSRIRNSPIHFVKLTKYGNGIDYRSVRDLAKVFREKETKKEVDRSYKGRKILNFKANRNDVTRKWDKKAGPYPSVNIIPYSPSKYPYKAMGISKKDPISDNEILRPVLNFTSNARPAMLKWRELEIEKTTIIKPFKSKRQKKYSIKVPIHLGYSRKFVEPADFSYNKIIRKRLSSLPGSSMTWLPAPSFNGLPQTIFHMKYPLKIRSLNTFDGVDNFL